MLKLIKGDQFKYVHLPKDCSTLRMLYKKATDAFKEPESIANAYVPYYIDP